MYVIAAKSDVDVARPSRLRRQYGKEAGTASSDREKVDFYLHFCDMFLNISFDIFAVKHLHSKLLQLFNFML